jgi:hypothetical protein
MSTNPEGFRDGAMDVMAPIKESQDALRQATRHVLTLVMLTVGFSKMYYTR